MLSFRKELQNRFLIATYVCIFSAIFAYMHLEKRSSYESLFFLSSIYLFAIVNFFIIWRHRKIFAKVTREKFSTIIKMALQESGMRVVAIIIPAVIIFYFVGYQLAVSVLLTFLFYGIIEIFFTYSKFESKIISSFDTLDLEE